VIDGQSYPVARDARSLPPGHSLYHRNLYNLSKQEIASLPRYDFRQYRAVLRVRTLMDGGRVQVIKPLEVAQ